MEIQGCNAAPSLDVLLLKQQFFTASVSNQRSDQEFQYAYRQHQPLLQPEFLPLKLAEWIAKNLAEETEELNLPDPGDLTRILTGCLVSDRRSNNLHTFHTLEFKYDLYSGVMRVLCCLFNMAQHRFHGKNVKVCQLHLH